MTSSAVRLALVFSTAACLNLGFGCASYPQDDTASKSNLTPGMAKKVITKGATKQAEIMEVFGPPDLVTQRDSQEIWTYDKIRYDVESSGGYLTVLLAGASNSRTRSSSTSTMLIVYFDSSDTVVDYRLSSMRF